MCTHVFVLQSALQGDGRQQLFSADVTRPRLSPPPHHHHLPHFLRRRFKRLPMCLPGLCNQYSESNHCVYTTCTQWLHLLLASVFDKQEVSAFCPDLTIDDPFAPFSFPFVLKKSLVAWSFRNRKITVWPDFIFDCTVVIAAFHCYVHTVVQNLTVCWQYFWFQSNVHWPWCHITYVLSLWSMEQQTLLYACLQV